MFARKIIGCSLLLVAMAAVAVIAQPAPGDGGGPGGPGGQGGPGGPPDPAVMRQRFSDRMKQMLGASDEEWKVLEPAVDKVRQLQRDAGGRMFGGPGGGPGGPGGPMGGPSGPGGPGGPPDQADRQGPGQDQPQSDVQQKLSDLRDALQDQAAKPDQIQAKLTALRSARAKAKADLAKAQDSLREMLTVRQEAVMVLMNVLE